MRTIRTLVTALAILVAGLSTGVNPAHAAIGNAATCPNGDEWYIHGPYDHDHNGSLWSWATVVPQYTSIAPPDAPLFCISQGFYNRIDQIDLRVWNGFGWVTLATNYESARSIGLYGDTVAAVVGSCMHGFTYDTVVWSWRTGDPNHYSTQTPNEVPC